MLTMNTLSTRFTITLRGAIVVALGVLALHIAVLLFIPTSQENMSLALSNGLAIVESGMAGAAALYATQKLIANKARQVVEAWRFFAAAILVYALGDFVYFLLGVVWHVNPYPSLADAFTCRFMPCFSLAFSSCLKTLSSAASGKN